MAEDGFTKALALGTDDPRALRWRGRTRMVRAMHRTLIGEDAAADFVAAEEDLKRATVARDRDAEAWEWLGVAATEQGSALAARGEDPSAAWSLAEDALAHAIERRQSPVWTLVRRAVLWTRRGVRAGAGGEPDLARADEDLARAMTMAPELPQAWLRRGVVHVERAALLAGQGHSPMAELDGAQADLDHTLSLAPRNADALIERARAHLVRARFFRQAGAIRKANAETAAATADLDEAVRINPHLARRRREVEGA
jgi:tetratricopeptide (TPR) repeat protein